MEPKPDRWPAVEQRRLIGDGMQRSAEWIEEAQAELDKAGLSYRAVICARCRLPEHQHPFQTCKSYVPTARWAAVVKLVDERIAARKAA